MPRSKPSLAHRIALMTTPALLGESWTDNLSLQLPSVRPEAAAFQRMKATLLSSCHGT